MVGQRVQVQGVISSMFGVNEAVITSWGARSYQAEVQVGAFPSEFTAHEEGCTILTDDGQEFWVFQDEVTAVKQQ